MKDKSQRDVSHNVLVVEGYADLRAAVVSTLAQADYRCDDVESSDAAVAMLRQHQYGAVLLSTRLPIAEDPVVTYLLAKDAGHRTKVIVMADPDQPTENYCALTKPFNRDELLMQVRVNPDVTS